MRNVIIAALVIGAAVLAVPNARGGESYWYRFTVVQGSTKADHIGESTVPLERMLKLVRGDQFIELTNTRDKSSGTQWSKSGDVSKHRFLNPKYIACFYILSGDPLKTQEDLLKQKADAQEKLKAIGVKKKKLIPGVIRRSSLGPALSK